MRSVPALLFPALLAASCVVESTDLQPVENTTTRTFRGYTQTPSSIVRALALDQNTGQWIIVGSAIAASVPSIPAGAWIQNPALYEWTINADLSTPGDPQGLCFLGPQCTARIGALGSSVIRLMFEEGSPTSPNRLVVFDENWSSCMNKRSAQGDNFYLAAYHCRAPSFPELRLRVIEDWARLPPRGASGEPVIGRTRDAMILLAAAGSSVKYSIAQTQGQWQGWRTISGGPASGLRHDAAPVYFMQHWFSTEPRGVAAIGNDGSIYWSSYDDASSTFSTLSPLPGVSGASGRFTGIRFEPLDIYAYSVAPNLVEISIFNNGVLAQRINFPGEEIAISRDVSSILPNYTIAAIRSGTTFSLWHFRDDLVALRKLGDFDAGAVEDWTAVVHDLQASHIYIGRPTSSGDGELVDYRFERGMELLPVPPFVLSTRVIGTYTLGPQPVRIAAERGSQMVVWTNAAQGLNGARFVPDFANGYWESMNVGRTASLAGRPALFNQVFFSIPKLLQDQEILIGALGTDQEERFGSLSRMMYRGDVEKTIDNYSTTSAAGCGSDPSVPDPIWMEDLAALQSDHFIFGDTMRALALLPPGVQRVLRGHAEHDCQSGPVQPASAHRACELAKYPFIHAPNATLSYQCADGLYFAPWSAPKYSIYYALARGLGINNNGTPPASWNVAAAGLPLSTLQQGAAIFNEAIGSNCDPDRCPGFLTPNPPETDGPEGAFVMALYAYEYGSGIRSWAQFDLQSKPCNDLLARKYNWLKDNIFHGYENYSMFVGPPQPLGLCP